MVGFFQFICLILLSFFINGCGPTTFVVGASAGDQNLKSTVVRSEGQWFSPRIAIVDISGLIHNSNQRQLLGRGENPVSLLAEQLQHAHSDPWTKAVILRINSPGGTVTASDAMYRSIQRFKEESGKPVIALMMDVAASGGYYIACAADRMIAYPTSVTGSIGVLVQTVSFKQAMDRFGIQAEAITSGSNKNIGSPLATLTPKHRQILQSLVDDFYSRFTEVVHTARPDISGQDFERITDGRVVSGTVAASCGLVDQTGDIEDAFKLAKNLAKIEHADMVIYHRPLDYVGSPYAHTPPTRFSPTHQSTTTQINIAQINLDHPMAFVPTSFYYVWNPLP